MALSGVCLFVFLHFFHAKLKIFRFLTGHQGKKDISKGDVKNKTAIIKLTLVSDNN